jgi:hypothetical protein
MAKINGFSKAWRLVGKPHARRSRKYLKNSVNRANRRDAKINLDYSQPIKHSAWDVT